MDKEGKLILHEAIVARKIITIRAEKVILDIHLADFYNVETRVLKQAVRRNIERFPDDFMFKLSENEIEYVVSQNVIPSKKHLGGAIPFAFTENGVAMLSGVLRSKQAVDINISIMRTFTTLRKMMLANKDIMKEIEEIRLNISKHDDKFILLFEYIKQFEETKQQELEQKNRPRIGY